MADTLDSGHVITDEDVDTAQLILDLDRALGRASDPLIHRVAQMPPSRVQSLLDEPPARSMAAAPNGHEVAAADALVRTLTSRETTRELAREVADQLPTDLDPAEQAKVTSKIEDVIQRRMIKLVAEAHPGR